MSLESTPNEAFLGGAADGGGEDLAALDSMGFTGGATSQYGMNTVAMSGSAHSSTGGGGIGRVGDGTQGSGFAGVSESLFDRIRARTAEEQARQSLSAQSSSVSSQPPSQRAAETEEPFLAPQVGGPSAFVSQQGQQPSSEPTVEGGGGHGAGTTNNNETTYSFAASAGEDFSQQAPPLRVPQYGKSRDDPYYAASSNGQPMPSTIQDKASMALAQTGETVKNLLSAGVSGAKAVGAMAQDKLSGGGTGGERSYNNNFLLREDSLEGGMGNSAPMSQPPPPSAATAAVPSGGEAGSTSDQAYSMLTYGKTFCEDVFGFFMQLPPWGKGVAGLVLLWLLYAIFG